MNNANLKPKVYNLTIAWLYPDLMSIYGDRGNIICLQKRCAWRGIKAEILPVTLQTPPSKLKTADLLFMGGAQDSQQTIVSKDLKSAKGNVLIEMIENKTPGLYICGAYQFLGKYYREADGSIIECLGVFDLHTENPGRNHKRLIGNIAIEVNPRTLLITHNSQPITTLVGFENHGGRTYLGKNIQPLGKVLSGFGNNGQDHTEGAVYKNSFGSYFHGPILPKNPQFADLLIKLALEKKYKTNITLSQLDDSLALQAHQYILNKIR